MADYIKLRVAAARLGVSMAFFVLLTGVAERARAAAAPTPSGSFLREASVPAGHGIDRVILKLDSALATLEHKLNTSFDTTHKLNQTFLKIKSADASFLKIKSANASFLKIDDANASFLKIDDANASFLKIDSTAANAAELGGLTPESFFQGNGHVVTGSVVAGATATPLLSLPGGIIVVSVSSTPGAGVQLMIHNGTSVDLPAVQDGNADAITLPANGDRAIPLGPEGNANQLHLQIFPNGSAFPEVVTLIVSSEDVTGGPTPAVVGQAFTGGV
ncbi:MAG TPA: hypothetical protein VIK04_20435 [Solirubrobacteraceae bacterium]